MKFRRYRFQLKPTAKGLKGSECAASVLRVCGRTWALGALAIAFPDLDVQSVAINDSLGNNPGAIDPAEPVKISVRLKNPWRRISFGVASATALLTTTNVGLHLTTAKAAYPAIPALGSADGTEFQFRVPSSATVGQSLHFTITPTSSLGTKAMNVTRDWPSDES